MGELQDAVALITGGGTGVGRAAARLFSAEGAYVIVANRRQDTGLKVQQECNGSKTSCTFVRTDITDKKSLDALFRRIAEDVGRIDVAFNCAGIDGCRCGLLEADEVDWDTIVATNMTATWRLIRAEAAMMRPQRHGSIVNMGSVSGLLGRPGRAAYNASRAAVHALTRTAAVELIPMGIRVNAVAPAAIDTEIFRRMTGNNPETARKYAAAHPIGRIAQPEEIAEVALWLSSRRSSFVVGHTLVVDGGVTLV